MDHRSPAPIKALYGNDQDLQFMIEKAKSLIAEQRDLVKERQELSLSLREIRKISRLSKAT